MLTNYIKIAFRNLFRHKIYSLINIVGLSVGFAAAILIILFITDEVNFDRSNNNYDRIGRLITTSQLPDNSYETYSLTPGNIGKRLTDEYPEVENYATVIDRYSWGRFTVEHGENKYYESDYLITDPNFLKMFDYKIIRGNRDKLLSEPNEMVLTKAAAQKLFGSENPIGKTIKTDRQWGDFKVTGIIQNPPANSHLQFSMLISMKSLDIFKGYVKAMNDLDVSMARTYVLFRSGYDLKNFTSKLDAFQKSNKGKSFGITDHISLQSLSEVHFDSQNIIFDLNAGSRSRTTLYILAAIGLLIILIAAINYTNLAAAKSINRIKEIGVRKVVGADKKQLVFQFLTEAVFITVTALLAAFLLALLALPAFNNFTGKTMSLFGEAAIFEIAPVFVLTFFIAIISGILPASVISKFKTVLILKGRTLPKGGFARFSKGLVVAQFAISIMMIFCTITIYNQMEYVRTKQLGFNSSNLLVVDINSSGSRRNFQALKNEFSKAPNVKNVSVTSRIPGDWKNISQVDSRNFGEDKQKNRKVYYIGADFDFLNTFGMSLLEGRNFDRNYSSDSANVIINSEAALALGLSEPVGKTLTISDGNDSGEYKIIGVVKDFNFQSLHEKISPMIIGFWNNPFISIDYYTARISGYDIPATLKYMSAVQQHFDNITPFEYNFLDERMSDFYNKDVREAAIVNFTSVLALLIACLGLFGLAAFSAEKRIKEIGVRKVLGASVSGIVVLFSYDFLKLILIACVIAFPAAYYLMGRWLGNFAYQISIGWESFLFSALITALIALATISYHSIKASWQNPVDSLRYE